ncbi:hypothetical protein DIPPA_03910 [Diplonema papillatum]|nr:hypothetical protein DIPPA_03910 [Diplonema papillatum]
MQDGSPEALQSELLALNEEMRRLRGKMQAALVEMATLEDRRSDIERQLLVDRTQFTQTVRAENAVLEREVISLRNALAMTTEVEQRKTVQSEVDNVTLRLQLDEVHHGLLAEKSLNSILAQELHAGGHPVVGLELSEGEPYDIAGVWVVSVVSGGPADVAGIRKGDVISEVAGIAVPTREAFRRVINGGDGGVAPARPGHQLSFRVHREDAQTSQPVSLTVMLTLGWSARRPEGRRSITVTRTDVGRSPSKQSMVPSPSSVRKGNGRERSTSPSRMSRFL